MKWEYWITAVPISDIFEFFNSLGAKGWELVSVTTDSGMPIAYFKRPLRTKSEDEIMKYFDYPQQDRSSLV